MSGINQLALRLRRDGSNVEGAQTHREKLTQDPPHVRDADPSDRLNNKVRAVKRSHRTERRNSCEPNPSFNLFVQK
jgi:hypothetical protein